MSEFLTGSLSTGKVTLSKCCNAQEFWKDCEIHSQDYCPVTYCGDCGEVTGRECQEPVKIAGNGETVTLGNDERYTDTLGNYGYRTWLSGSWVCYTDGVYCDCYTGEGEE